MGEVRGSAGGRERERESARMSVGHMTAVEQLVFHVSVKVATLPYLPRKAGRVRDLAL